MKSSLRLAGAAALCAALLLTACAKKTDQTTTSSADTSTSTTAPAADTSATPDAGSTPVAEVSPSSTPDVSATAAATAGATPAAAATAVSTTTTTTTTATATSGNGASAGFITLPVYPGASETKDGEMSMSTNTGSLEMKVYTTKDDTKKVAEWYKAHLPNAFKGGILTTGDKTVGTFADEHPDGDQSVIVANDSSGSGTRIQLTTKHGK
jgi:hypothetical protein